MLLARSDLQAAVTLAIHDRDWHNSAYHAAQSVEKALKAALAASGVVPPRHHDVDALRDALPVGWEVRRKHPDLATIVFYGVAIRYPEDYGAVTGPKAAGARRTAASVYASVRRDLARRGFDIRGT
jgi:HEPN domain-containing protein